MTSDIPNVEADVNYVTLRVLAAVEENQDLTQRSLALQLGVALGLAHSYLKRCVKKGYVKITQVPSRRYVYYLTPHGFAEKTRLTAEYLNQSFRFYRLAKEQLSQLMDECVEKGWTRIALAGGGELAEIALLSVATRPVQLVAIYDPEGNFDQGVKVVNDAGSLTGLIDAVIITSLDRGRECHDHMISVVPPERVLSPRLLKLNPLLAILS